MASHRGDALHRVIVTPSVTTEAMICSKPRSSRSIDRTGDLPRSIATTALRIEVNDSTLAASVTGQKKPICHPLAGYIASFLEEAWQRPVKVYEKECMATGGAQCVFEVE